MGKVAARPAKISPSSKPDSEPLRGSVVIARNGRIVIPANVRQAFGLKEGDELSLRATPQGIVLKTPAMAVRSLRAVVRKFVEPGRSLARELVAERRDEAARE